MRKTRSGLIARFRSSVLMVGGAGFVAGLLWFELGKLVPGFSGPEVAARTDSASLQAVIDNPLFLPHKLVQLGLQQLGHHGPLAMRSASALFGLVAVGCFYFVVKQWYSRRVALLGTFLFATSSGLLHWARVGTGAITFTLLFGVVACVIWLQTSRARLPAIIVGVLLLLALLYTPGMIWFVVPGVVWQLPRLTRFLSRQPKVILGVLTLLVLIALLPLGWAFYHDLSLIKTYVGLPQTFASPINILKNIAYVPWHVFVHGPKDPVFGLGDVPVLDWFGTAMFVVGLTAYFSNRRLDRAVMVMYVGAVGTLLIGIGGPMAISLLLPFVYLVIASGIAYMLQQWFTVFPLNPVARTIGATLMTIAVLISAYYHINHYFIAWPHTPETQATFHISAESSTIESR